MLSSLGLMLVSSTFVGLIIGYYLDKWFKTDPYLTIIFFVLGIISGFFTVFRDVKKMRN
ncbi:MAG: AtpZ/AtpI family protein [Candidatus Firestonebacteria bacterium]